MTNNLNIIRSIYKASSEEIIPILADILAENVQWTEAAGFPTGGTYIGLNAIKTNVFYRLATEWSGFKTEAKTFLGDDNKVAVFGIYSGTSNTTGKYFEATFAHLWELEHEKVIKMEQFVDSAMVQAVLK
ncbi:nuclear transport factor 2 family protein [Acinetobacter sp. B5B]|uniref:nuclear transport factor 2 family protein n=1 Tax=Acinetobacter baretiae TaxID=2605383 RepID=UPI0018C25923|nr:nuclear transport factor 2 family protein [Acinetobacter baretiae]MBF7683107.1 nuclear transport factor 2 family protein [Acinetobacter baretiae]